MTVSANGAVAPNVLSTDPPALTHSGSTPFRHQSATNGKAPGERRDGGMAVHFVKIGEETTPAGGTYPSSQHGQRKAMYAIGSNMRSLMSAASSSAPFLRA